MKKEKEQEAKNRISKNMTISGSLMILEVLVVFLIAAVLYLKGCS